MTTQELNNLIQKSKKPAFDFHGTIDSGKFRVPKQCVVITGELEEEGEHIKTFCDNYKIKADIHFRPREHPVDLDIDNIDQTIGKFKAEKCRELGITDYFDDDPAQIYWIKKFNPELNVVYINRLNYIICTKNMVGLPYAYRLVEEGNPVIMALLPDDEKDPILIARQNKVGAGMVKKYPIDHVLRLLHAIKDEDKDDFFIDFDFNYGGEYGEIMEKMGFPGIYARTTYRQLEEDRHLAQEFVRAHYPALRTLEEREFKHIDDALKFIKTSGKIWVVKCNNDNVDVYVTASDDINEAYRDIEAHLKTNKTLLEKDGFILQEKIPYPCEVTPETLYIQGEPIHYIADLEYKKRGGGNVGRMTGCSLDVNFVLDPNSRLARIALLPYQPHARNIQQNNFMDASVLIDRSSDTPYWGEFCPRQGYNSFLTELAMLPSASHYFESVKAKRNPFEAGKKFGASIRIFNDMSDKNRYCQPDIRIQVKGKNVWLWDAYMKNNQLYNAGASEAIGVVTGAGDTLEQAVFAAIRHLDEIIFPNMHYRKDFLDNEWWSVLYRYQYLQDHHWL